MRLVRAMAYYAEPLLLLAAMAALTVWNASHFDLRVSWWSADDHNVALMPPRLLALGAALLLPVAARLEIMRRHRIPTGLALRSMLLNAVLVCSVAWPVARRLISEACGRRLGFDVTGRSDVPTLAGIVATGYPIYLASWAVVITTLAGPVTAYWNLFWALPGALAPWLIRRYQRCQSQSTRA